MRQEDELQTDMLQSRKKAERKRQEISAQEVTRKPKNSEKSLNKKHQKLLIENEKKKKAVNKEFARITYAFVALFLCMMGYIAYYQIVQSSNIINSPYNSRQDILAQHVTRGKILDSEGVMLAETIVNDDGTEIRNYPLGEMAVHAVGYDVKGKSGVELAANFSLLTSNAFFMEKISNEFQDEKDMGDSIVTTLDAKLQEVAYKALGDFKGAAFVMEPDTGKILAMVSKPSFNPSTVSADWETLTTDENSSLLNRATQSSMVPGSVFKIVTALEYMREYPDYADYTYNCTGSIEVDGVKIECFNGTVHGEQTLEEAFANSCNSAFVDMGLQLDNDELHSTAESLLFNKTLPGAVTSTRSSFVLTSEAQLYETMMTAMGQGDTVTSPYHMALITAAVANGGKLMEPYIIDSIENHTGDVVKNYTPSAYSNLMTASEAEQLSQYMQAVVSYGTGTVLSGSSYTVAGKTGTAEYSSNKSESHSWFVGFTNVDNPDIVVSVVLEQSNGEERAISVAKKIMDCYYQ